MLVWLLRIEVFRLTKYLEDKEDFYVDYKD